MIGRCSRGFLHNSRRIFRQNVKQKKNNSFSSRLETAMYSQRNKSHSSFGKMETEMITKAIGTTIGVGLLDGTARHMLDVTLLSLLEDEDDDGR